MKVKIYIADAKEILKQYRGYFGIVVTSPPYYTTISIRNRDYLPPIPYKNYESYLEDMKSQYKAIYNSLMPGRIAAINVSEVVYNGETYPIPYDTFNILREIGFKYRDTIIWEKTGELKSYGTGRRAGNILKHRKPLYYTPNRQFEYIFIVSKGEIKRKPCKPIVKIEREYLSNIWHIKTPTGINRLHPLEYPLELPYWLLNFYGYRDEPVLDPFAGSGTTALAALKLGFREIVLIDIDIEVLPMIFKKLNIPGQPPKSKGEYRYRGLDIEYEVVIW